MAKSLIIKYNLSNIFKTKSVISPTTYICLESALNKLQNGINKYDIILCHSVIFSGKPKNCKISDNFRKKPDKKSLNNKLYEYEAIFEIGFPKKKLFDFKVNFTNFH